MKLAPRYPLALLLSLLYLAPLWAEKEAKDEKEAPAAEPAPAAAAENAAEADPFQAQLPQYEQMLLPKMWQELELVRATIDLSPEQRPKIKAAAQASVKKAAKGYVQGLRLGNNNDPSLALRQDLGKAFAGLLTKEQLALYEEAAKRRAEGRKRVTLRVVTAELDNFLFLSQDQRDKIQKSLADKWQDNWESWLMIANYGGRYFPTIPDEHLTPHLTPQQKTVWQGAQKITPGFGGGVAQAPMDTEWWDGQDVADKTKPEENKPEKDAPEKVEAQKP